jgi:homopolymeric O-antigen transport system ATP-binding protein
MSDIAIRIDRLSKEYQIGKAQTSYRTLRDTLTDLVGSPFRRLLRARAGTPGSARDAYQVFRALDDVSLEVKRGEVLGIIGRNGAGKSTLLKVLSRITEPDSGLVEIYGRLASLLEVGTGFHGELTGRENLYLSGAILGMKRAEIRDKFDEIVAFAEVERFIDTPVKHYSSGMYLRLAFAVAAHLQPEILLVDEVLAVGDAAFQNKCIGKMSQTARDGRTVVFVSHNMAAITQLCDKAVWLERGRVRMIDASDDVVRAYLSDGNSQVVERQWSYPGDAPGDDRVRLVAARVLQHGRVATVIDINVPSSVELDFVVLQDVRNLITGIYVMNATGTGLFRSRDWRQNQLTPGRYRKRVEFQAQFFAETRLTIDVGLGFFDPVVASVTLDDVLIVDTMDSAHPLAVRGPYKGPWPGVLRVGLAWSDPTGID